MIEFRMSPEYEIRYAFYNGSLVLDGLGISKRTYQQRKQISKLHPEVKSQLVSSEYANNLVDLIKLSSEAEDVQKYVCELLMSGRCKTFKAAFIQAKYKEFRLRSKPKFDFDFKETPTTIVKSIVEQFDNMNKGNRSDAKLY